MTDAEDRRHSRFITVSSYVQLVANFVTLGAVIAVLFYSNAQFQQQTTSATEGNRSVIEAVRQDLDQHARDSTERNCVIARELEYLVTLNPDIGKDIVAQVERFTRQACKVVPIGTPASSPIPGGPDT